MTALDEFDRLTAHGLKVIPLRQNTKIPLCKAWQKLWEPNRFRRKLQMFPEANIGLLLGEIIDVEGDSQKANVTIAKLVGDYPHPCYQSTKSVHHLFATPEPDLRIFKTGDIEFRGKGHQSVLPPSNHQGIQYKWIQDLALPIPPMPEPLLEFFSEKKYGKKINPDHTKVYCKRCDLGLFIHDKRLKLELMAFKSLGLSWQCHRCRPLEIRKLCRLLDRS